MPVSMSGVRLALLRQPGVETKQSTPARVMVGSGMVVPATFGVWQLAQPSTPTRYCPRMAALGPASPAVASPAAASAPPSDPEPSPPAATAAAAVSPVAPVSAVALAAET